jgi:hypothetical protein
MVWKLLCKVREERGQGLVLAALSMVVVMGFAAMAVDVGSFMHDRRQLQNAADAAALAGAAGLPDASLATEKAHEWATKNFDGSDQVVTSVNVYTYRAPNDRIEVTVKGETDFVFARVLGMDKATVRASATAGRVPITASCIAPWATQGVVNDASADFGLDPLKLYVFQLAPGSWSTPGNFGALAVYGSGTMEYRNAVEGNCGQVNACNSDSPYVAEGQTLSCSTQTGSLGQNTNDGLTERYPSSTWATCDVQPGANGYTNAQSKAQLSTCKDRAMAVAVINAFPPQGQSGNIQIWGLASFYIAGWDRWPPWGNGNNPPPPNDGMVWGYLIPATSLPAWSVKWGWDNANPFAPLVIVLVK